MADSTSREPAPDESPKRAWFRGIAEEVSIIRADRDRWRAYAEHQNSCVTCWETGGCEEGATLHQAALKGISPESPALRASETTPDEKWMMPRFQKKPTIIDAVRFENMADPQKQIEMLAILDGVIGWQMVSGGIQLPTANGPVIATRGDWICRQKVLGTIDVWPCAHRVFSATYEPAAELLRRCALRVVLEGTEGKAGEDGANAC